MCRRCVNLHFAFRFLPVCILLTRARIQMASAFVSGKQFVRELPAGRVTFTTRNMPPPHHAAGVNWWSALKQVPASVVTAAQSVLRATPFDGLVYIVYDVARCAVDIVGTDSSEPTGRGVTQQTVEWRCA